MGLILTCWGAMVALGLSSFDTILIASFPACIGLVKGLDGFMIYVRDWRHSVEIWLCFSHEWRVV